MGKLTDKEVEEASDLIEELSSSFEDDIAKKILEISKTTSEKKDDVRFYFIVMNAVMTRTLSVVIAKHCCGMSFKQKEHSIRVFTKVFMTALEEDVKDEISSLYKYLSNNNENQTKS